jgi:glutaredoxin-dependent peroxiredoxin
MSLLNTPAPGFTLFNTVKKEVSLHDQQGKNVVLLFFPFAFSGTCTRELCSTRDELTFYNEVNAVVFGISTDAVFSLIRYKEELKLNFELLSDFNKEISKAYNSLYADFIFNSKGVSKRSAFVIDANGIVRYEEILENAGNVPDFDKIKACLKGLQGAGQQ